MVRHAFESFSGDPGLAVLVSQSLMHFECALQCSLQWFAALNAFSLSQQAVSFFAQPPVSHRSIVRPHVSLHVAVVTAHAWRHASSWHAASQLPQSLVQLAPHVLHVPSQAPEHASLSLLQSVLTHVCCIANVHANMSSSAHGEPSAGGGGGPGTKSHDTASAETTRGSVHPFGQCFHHACVSGPFGFGGTAGAGDSLAGSALAVGAGVTTTAGGLGAGAARGVTTGGAAATTGGGGLVDAAHAASTTRALTTLRPRGTRKIMAHRTPGAFLRPLRRRFRSLAKSPARRPNARKRLAKHRR